LKAVTQAKPEDLDWIGLQVNRFHSRFLQLIFKPLTESVIAEDPNKRIKFTKPIMIGAGGWKPGRSSDDFSVRLANAFGAGRVINLSNIDFVYDRDPKKFSNAKKIEKISWAGLRKIIGKKWIPGANLPFDPTAATLAQKVGLEVVIADGKDLKNLENILDGKKFKGTVIY
jgi:uridylate kinase